MSAWQSIRLLRAQPPRRVTDDRLGVFVSALEQSEQLMRAARDIGSAARPLPLFYALSQAGRAIAAAHLPGNAWRLAGHGLTVPPQDNVTDLVQRVVEPRAESKKLLALSRRASFQGVADAVGSEKLTGRVELGAVWAAIPELIEPVPQIPARDRSWRRVLVVFDEQWNTDPATRAGMGGLYRLGMLVTGLPRGATPQELLDEIAHYPAAATAQPKTRDNQGRVEVVKAWTPTGEFCAAFSFTGPEAFHPGLDEVTPLYRGRRLLIPRLEDRDFLSPLMLWWLLLFGLSSVARYDPELWVAALDVNSSPCRSRPHLMRH